MKRVGYYLIGVALGTLMVIFFFGDRDIKCSYFPTDRVLSDLQKKEILLAHPAECPASCLENDSAFFYDAIRRSEIDFGYNQRGTDHTCNEYLLNYQDGEFAHRIYIRNCDSTATVRELILDEDYPCECP